MYFGQLSHNTHVIICYTSWKANFKIYNHQKYIVVSVLNLKKNQNGTYYAEYNQQSVTGSNFASQPGNNIAIQSDND